MDIVCEAMILAFTDGVTDVTDENGEFIDEQEIYDFVKDNYRLTAVEFNEELMKKIDHYKHDERYPDDITILTCKIFG